MDPKKDHKLSRRVLIQEPPRNESDGQQEEGERFRPQLSKSIETQEPFKGMKIRRRASMYRQSMGDYINVPSNQQIVKLLTKQGLHIQDTTMKVQQKKTQKRKKNMIKIGRPERELGSSDWIRSLPWQNVTPDDSAAVLVGSQEGGFICLEEVEGEFYSQFQGNDLVLPFEEKSKKIEKRNEALLSSTDEATTIDALDCFMESKASRKRKRRKKKVKNQTLDNNIAEAEDEIADRGLDSSAGTSDELVPTNIKKNGCQKKLDHGQNVISLEHQVTAHEQRLNDLPAWSELGLHWKLIEAMATLGFTQPTPIQRSCIPAAAHQGKDIIGAAETGSGKTLAFVIPILQRLLEEEERCHGSAGNKEGAHCRMNANGNTLRALIVTPTRELALQVCDHFRAAAKFTVFKVVPIVGGMSAHKQERLLKKRPHAVVGTPGRLWELMSAGEKHLVELASLSFFVLDEADRMVEKGHFQELQSIIDMLPMSHKSRNIPSDPSKMQSECSIHYLGENIEVGSPKGPTGESCDADTDNWKSCKPRQTFVFSATLAVPPGFRKQQKKEFLKAKESLKNENWSVATLSQRAGVRRSAAIFNLTTQNILVDKLEESIIQCRAEEKDMYLYYLLMLHGCGRAIVFCTSIAAVRRVAALLHLLQIPAWPLHAQMQQRQRLKAMDRFRAGDNSILVATDVAARGLDIQDIRVVIHYQLPHSTEVYVHRSGRTARASQDGCSVLLLSPSDQMKYYSLCRALHKLERLPSFPVNSEYMPAIVRRIELAKHVDLLLRKHTQRRAQASWLQKNADALGMSVKDTGKAEENDESENHLCGKRASIQLKRLQQELNNLLEQPLEPRSISHQFVTGAGVSPLVVRQLKDFARQKMLKHHVGTAENSKKAGSKMGGGRKGLVVIGQETIEPLAALRTSILM